MVEPEDNPQQIIKRMEQLIDDTAPGREDTTPLDEVADPIAMKHRDAVQKGAEETSNE